MEETVKIFTEVEMILGSLVGLILDGISALLDIFFNAGALLQNIAWLAYAFWFTVKGCKATASLVKRYIIPLGVQLVPFLPTITATFLVTVYMENHPEKFAAIESVAKVAGGKVTPK